VHHPDPEVGGSVDAPRVLARFALELHARAAGALNMYRSNFVK
jgi:hypothetical protein